MESVAASLDWTLEQLTLFLTSQEGLQLLADCELASAARARAAAAAHLTQAIDALGMMLAEYAHTTRRTPLDDRKHATHVLREVQRANARRAAHLLFRIAHYSPRPIRMHARLSDGPATPASMAGEATAPSLPSTPQSSNAPAAAEPDPLPAKDLSATQPHQPVTEHTQPRALQAPAPDSSAPARPISGFSTPFPVPHVLLVPSRARAPALPDTRCVSIPVLDTSAHQCRVHEPALCTVPP